MTFKMTTHHTGNAFTLTPLLFLLIFSLSYVNNIAFAAPKTEVSASTGYALLKHENYDANGYILNTEKGWLPGGIVAISNTSRRLKSIFSFTAYGGDIKYQQQLPTGKINSSNINERIMRFSYRFEYKQPRNRYAFYSTASFNDWRREIKTAQETSASNRQYRWWRAEAGIRLELFDSPRSTLQTDFGISHNFFSEMLIDLTADSLGKPLFKLKNRPGGAINMTFKYRFTKEHSGGLFANATYWQFGNSNKRTISNNVKNITLQEYESQSLTFALGATYFYRF